jgi:hypothetical protein
MKILKVLVILGLLATLVISCGQPSDYDSTQYTKVSNTQ